MYSPQKRHLPHIPLLTPAIMLMAGIVAATFILSPWFLALPLSIVTAGMAVRRSVIATAGILMLAGYFIARLSQPTLPPTDIFNDETHRFQGTVTAVSPVKGNGWQQLTVRIDSIGQSRVPSFPALVLIPAASDAFNTGDNITFPATPETTASSPDLPDIPDINAMLRAKGLVMKAVVSENDISVIGHHETALSPFTRFSEHITDLIYESRLSNDTKYFLNAIVTGDDSDISLLSRSLFSQAGTAHILALSGLHVAIISTVITLMLLPLYVTRHRRAMRAITIALLWLFALATGMSASVTRAVIMASLFLIGRIIQHKSTPLNSLCAASIIILVADPQTLFDIGFQLSFLSVGSILLFATNLNPWRNSRKKANRLAGGYLSASIAAIIGSGFVAAFYFHVFPVYFLLSNAVTTLLLPFLIGAGIIVIIGQAMGFSMTLLCAACDSIYDAIIGIMGFITSLPGASIDNIYLPWPSTLLYIATAFTGWLAVAKRQRVYITASAMLMATLVLSIAIAQPVVYDSEMFISGRYGVTEAIIKERDTLWTFATSTHKQVYDTDMLKDYTGRRGIHSIKELPVRYHSNIIQRDNATLYINGLKFLFVSNDSIANRMASDSTLINYAVICRGFRGEIMRAYESLRPDTVLLSSDLDHRRHNRYVNSLKEAGIPYRTLRDTPFRLRLERLKRPIGE